MVSDATERRVPPAIFISHARRDRDVAQTLGGLLHQAGLQTYDPAKVAPGDNVLAAVSSEIDRADVVIVLVSAHAASSEWVQTEAAMAVGRVLSGRGGRVIPVILGDATPPFLLREFQGIHVRDPDDLHRVVEIVRDLPPSSASDETYLMRSIEFQERALAHERLRYEFDLQRERFKQDRVVRVLAVVLGGLGIVLSLGASVIGKTDALAIFLGPVTAMLASAVGYYFGRAQADELAHRDKAEP